VIRHVGDFKRAIGSRVIQIHPISILAPLAVGVVAQVCTIIIHLVPVRATVNLIRREKGLGHVGMPWTDLGIFARVAFYASLAHLVEIALWAVLFIICGEFTDFGTAFYHSAVNYTSLGYGDFIMTPSWRLLGPLETANGTLLFGVSTAMIFGVMLWLIQTRFTDLKD
jgi:Ion channel